MPTIPQLEYFKGRLGKSPCGYIQNERTVSPHLSLAIIKIAVLIPGEFYFFVIKRVKDSAVLCRLHGSSSRDSRMLGRLGIVMLPLAKNLCITLNRIIHFV